LHQHIDETQCLAAAERTLMLINQQFFCDAASQLDVSQLHALVHSERVAIRLTVTLKPQIKTRQNGRRGLVVPPSLNIGLDLTEFCRSTDQSKGQPLAGHLRCYIALSSVAGGERNCASELIVHTT
jgi:hypothetical protein